MVRKRHSARSADNSASPNKAGEQRDSLVHVLDAFRGLDAEQVHRVVLFARALKKHVRAPSETRQPKISYLVVDSEESHAAHRERENSAEAWRLRRELLAESIPVAEAARRIGRTEQTAINRAKAKEMLGIRDGVRWMFPVWQFEPALESGLVPGLINVLQAVDAPPFSVALWMRSASQVLDGMRPIDALKRGEIDRVVLTARSLGSQ